jgi:hypothetical protein
VTDRAQCPTFDVGDVFLEDLIMALFGLFRRPKNKIKVRCLDDWYNLFEIVGEAAFQHDLLLLAGGRKNARGVEIKEQAELHPEPFNPYDQNAVAVYIRGTKVGYFSRQDAPIFKAFLQKVRADSAVCDALIVGGWDDGAGDEGHFGVKLSLSWPPRSAQ